MPPLLKEHMRIIFRPQGGLDVRKIDSIRLAQSTSKAAGLRPEGVSQDIICANVTQCIIMTSTAIRVNANAYLKDGLITIDESQFEVSTYESAPHATCKGALHWTKLSDEGMGQSQTKLERNIFNPRNPLALMVKRIKNTETVVIAFGGHKVRTLSREMLTTPQAIRPRLCLRQEGHRTDVRPSAQDVVCRGCGAANPDSLHTCTPKCTDKSCRQSIEEVRCSPKVNFHQPAAGQVADTPFALQKSLCHHERSRHPLQPQETLQMPGSFRVREAALGAAPDPDADTNPGAGSGPGTQGTESSSSTHAPSLNEQSRANTTWGNRVRGSTGKLTGGPMPEQHLGRLSQLDRANAAMRSIIE
ncbi:hypothetical protein HPB49_017276 [Dermacentor silvarum]|uniref:Uncharacterized protein n=1 Tax=Dermacentor silvarum TaxID=543639 RepID=A0ACB8DK53_DERSI|nr:hypothetical protein HPB49_017276 [Dermacentor silvarum]